MTKASLPWDHEVDLVIVGSGAGAVTAALRARKWGKTALIVEKAEFFGGSTALSGGVTWIPNAAPLLRAGADDSIEKGRAYLDACAGPYAAGTTRERREAYLSKGPEMISFLESEGMEFAYLDGFSDYHEGEYPGGLARGRSLGGKLFALNRLGDWLPKMRRASGIQEIPATVPEIGQLVLSGRTWKSRITFVKVGWRMIQRKLGRLLVAAGASLQGRLFLLAKNAGQEIWLGSPLTDLIREDGRVVGVVVRQNGRDVRVRARYGVLLDAGGFARNPDMRANMSRVPHSRWTVANEGDTGEVMQMATGLGADTAMTQEAWWIPASFLPDGSISWHNPIDMGKPHAIVVDQGGSRYVNESTSYVTVGLAMFERDKTVPAVPSWFIVESRHRDRYRMGIAPAGKTPEDWITSGYMKRADTIDDLARQCDIPPEQLRKTVDRFNGFAEAGHDADFGKGESAYNRVWGDPTNKPNPSLGKIEIGPFYAVKVFPADVGTCGGLVADEYARVLDKAGQPIPGLYAAGNITASVMGPSYPGAGASIGASMVFSYIAADHALRGS
ncbi:FAD-binding protein [Sphingosinicella soli]|uniref:3-oxosteroid 1-dehydrogenase n=1 Tax=Sphingosinicella soli TaxID=333708 RepID=A0A7W7B0U9_9SPHN|nr:3-oxosteroid 1-dehydrogenase [Sphingosinicella soli]